MPAINQEINVQVHDSSVDRYVKKMEQSATATDWLIGKLDVYAETAKEAFTDSQRDRALDSLARQMDRIGLVFTSATAEAERFDLLARSSLADLAKNGDISANALGRSKFGDHLAKDVERQARAAEQRLAAEMKAAQTAANAAQKEINARNKAAAAAQREQDKIARAAQKAAKEQERLAQSTKKTESWAKRAVSAFMGFNKTSNPVEKLSNRLTRTVITLFSVRRVLRYITDAIERAPDKIGGAFSGMGTTVNDTFSRVVVNAMAGMQGGVEKLNAAMNSSSGQRFFRGLDTAAKLAGMAIGALLEGGAKLIDFLGNHAVEVFTVAAAAAAFFAAQMIVVHGAELLAAAPLVVTIGLISAFVTGLMKAGVTSEEIFTFIGKGAGWLYALGYNLVADTYNLLASFAEFFANFLNDPVGSIVHLLTDMADFAIGIFETIGKGIDAIFKTDIAGNLSSLRNKIQSWADENYGEKKITLDRMAHIDYSTTMESWGSAAGSLGNKLANGGLDSLTAVQLKAIKSDTSSIKKSVDSTKEDLKSLVDIAERQYINRINLTTQQPVITVNGQNTGNFKEDLQTLVDAITEILIEQTSSGATVATAMP